MSPLGWCAVLFFFLSAALCRPPTLPDSSVPFVPPPLPASVAAAFEEIDAALFDCEVAMRFVDRRLVFMAAQLNLCGLI